MTFPMLSKIRRTLALPVVCLLTLFASACDEKVVEKKEIIRPVKALKVADASNFQKRWFSGRAKGTQEIDLSFRVSGPLIERKVDVGTAVSEGDVIARIDPATFKADLDRANANVARAEATLTNAIEQLKRNQTLLRQGHVAQARVDRFLAAEREARAAVTAEKAAYKRKKLDLNFTVLKAPFSGVVVKAYVENFQDVRAKQPIVRLVDNSKVEMVVYIPENLISQAHTVKAVAVKFDALPGVTVPAKIMEIGTEASETTRTYPVTVIMDQPPGARILPGMAGKATRADIGVEQTEGAGIVVPETAVLTKDDPSKSFVWIIDEAAKTVSTRAVTTGAVVDQGLEIADGLKPGEWIVTAGVNYLKEGQKVRILEQ